MVSIYRKETRLQYLRSSTRDLYLFFIILKLVECLELLRIDEDSTICILFLGMTVMRTRQVLENVFVSTSSLNRDAEHEFQISGCPRNVSQTSLDTYSPFPVRSIGVLFIYGMSTPLQIKVAHYIQILSPISSDWYFTGILHMHYILRISYGKSAIQVPIGPSQREGRGEIFTYNACHSENTARCQICEKISTLKGQQNVLHNALHFSCYLHVSHEQKG